ncbi:MAG: hypothetical protein AAGK97_10190, partial [Bacteroidota bacterium]
INAASLNLNYEPPTVRPLAMRPDAKPESYNAYALLGYGTQSSPIAELAYNTENPGWYKLGFNFSHHSANNSNKIADQRFSETGLLVNGEYTLSNNATVGGQINYDQNDYYLYGFNEVDSTQIIDNPLRRFNFLNLTGNIKSDPESEFNYVGNIDVYTLKDNFAAKETGLLLGGGLSKIINEKHLLGINIEADFSQLKDTTTQKLNNLSAHPFIKFTNPNYQINVGAEFAHAESMLSIFPELEFSTKIIGSTLIAYAGISGELRKNSFKNLSNYNPYITSRIDSINNTRSTSYFIGGKGTVKGIRYGSQISYHTFTSLALFINDVNDMKRFKPIYDNGNMIQIKANASIDINKQLSIDGTLAKNFYSLDKEEKPWSLPSFEANLNAKYKMLKNNKLHLKGNLYMENGVPVMDFDTVEGQRNLGPLLDLSLSADYFFSKNIGAFVHANNLLNNKRMRWNGYPSFGLNLKGGILARF